MLKRIMEMTADFLESMPKTKRKKKGQFFTSKETAEFMAKMFDYSILGPEVNVLDPGAGTGVLTAAFIDEASRYQNIQSINITCYENDSEVLPVLHNVLNYIVENSNIMVTFTIIEEDYLLSQANDFEGTPLANQNAKKYDAIIGNPPYLRIMRNSAQAQAMPTVVHGAPNLYFLFASMSLFNLKDNKELVYIIPRSWTSGEYFKAFREYFLRNGKLSQIHLFASRDKVFSQEQVLQETIILKLKKTAITPPTVRITSSRTNYDFENITSIDVPYSSVVTGKSLYVFLPTSNDEIATIQQINRYSETLPEVGYRMRTGIVVDFRQKEELRTEAGDGIIPLFYAQHIKNGRVNHDESGKDFDWIIDKKQGLIQPNENYVFCKRFTAKEERRRLQGGIYLSQDFPEYKTIGTQNKINFVNRVDKTPMNIAETYGIYALLNTTLFDQFYRILDGSTQVNSTEVNNIPVPPKEKIIEIGNRLLRENRLDTDICDYIVKEVAYNE